MDLLERGSLLDELDALAARAVTTGCLALVSGEAGAGKTTLVEAFRQRRGRDIGTFVGRCDPLLTPRALGPLHDVAREAGGRLAAGLAGGASREDLFDALLEELRDPAGPRVLVIEDAHWADEATMDLLVFLGRRITGTTALLIVTFRDDELDLDHPLRGVLAAVAQAGARRLVVPPLSASAVDELARRAGRDPAGLHALTGGNALLVTEMLSARDEGVPATVRDVALTRYAALPEAAREVVRLVAVVPSRAELWLVERAVGGDAGALRRALTSAVGSGLLVLTGDSVGFRHELLRRGVESALSHVDRRELNQRVLEVLSSPDAGAVDLARTVHHAREAADVEAIVRHGPEAAERAAAVSAHREAVGHYRAVLAHRDRLDPETLAGLLRSYSTECYLTGLSTEAVAAGQAAVQLLAGLGDQERAGASLRWLSRLYWWDGDRREAEAAVARAITTLEALEPGHELAMAYSTQAQLDMLGSRHEEAIAWAGRALLLAERLGDHEAMTHALTNIGSARVLAADPRGRADLERAIDVAQAAGLDDDVARALGNLATASVEMHDYRRAGADLDRALAFVQDRELSGYAQHLLGHRARLRLDVGDWDGAQHDAELALGQQVAGGMRVVDGLVPLGLLRARRGDPEARATLDEAATLAGDDADLQWAAPLAAARAEHAWLLGDDAAAVRRAAPMLERAAAAGHPWFVGELALWTWLAGGEPPIEGAAAPYRLQITGQWRDAARAWEALGCGYHRALALALGDGGEEQVAEALAVLDGLGARGTAARVRRELRRRGRRRVPRGPNRSSVVNPWGLTNRQLDVLALLAAGLTDAEIAERLSLSTKTVGHHVSALLGKLGVASRYDAGALAGRHGIVAKPGERRG